MEKHSNTNQSAIHEEFNKLERKCLGYEDYIDANEENYLQSLKDLRKLVVMIQTEGIFSDNEDLKEIDTDNLRFLLIPFYEADILCRIMDKR